MGYTEGGNDYEGAAALARGDDSMAGFYIIMGGLALGAVILSIVAVRADRKSHRAK